MKNIKKVIRELVELNDKNYPCFKCQCTTPCQDMAWEKCLSLKEWRAQNNKASDLENLALRMGANWAAFRNQRGANSMVWFKEMDESVSDFTNQFKKVYGRKE